MADELTLKTTVSDESVIESFRKRLKGNWLIKPTAPNWYFDYFLIKVVALPTGEEDRIVTAGLVVKDTINLPVGRIPKNILKVYSKKFQLCSGTLIFCWHLNNILYTFKFPIEAMDPLMLVQSIKPDISGEFYDVDLDLLLQHEFNT